MKLVYESSSEETHAQLSAFEQTLVDQQILSASQAFNAKLDAEQRGETMVTYLVKQGIATSKAIATAASDYSRLPITPSETLTINQQAIEMVPRKFVQRYHCLPLDCNNEALIIGCSDPDQEPVFQAIQFHTGLHIQRRLFEESALESIIYEWSESEHIHQLSQFQTLSASKKSLTLDNKILEDHGPIVAFLHDLLGTARKQFASDIHFEPYKNDYRIRFRIDGILYEMAKPERNTSDSLATCLKVMAQLDIAERRQPQDGRFQIKPLNQEAFDIRISTIPTMHGEKIVLRLLNTTSLSISLQELGFDENQLNCFMEAIQKPQGLIIITGPTGSGKTITLYSALKALNHPAKNISSVEDPVEIHLSGINQIPINPKIDLSFSKILRALLRQDPDILMIGEIRDEETAEIAIKAAQTGHLVLSTLHTNSAIECITRLMHMGIAPYQIVGAASLVIAQRLARKLCIFCKIPDEREAPELLTSGLLKPDETFNFEIKRFQPSGCEHCQNGYRERIGIFEFLTFSKNIQESLLKTNSHQAIFNIARNEGFKTLREYGIEKVYDGLTSLDEIKKITLF